LVERFEREFDFFKQITKGLHDAHAPILAGTDTPSGFRLPGRQLHEELQLYCEIGFTPYEALTAATRNAALFLDERADFGIVAVGKRADLILVDENPLQNIGNAARRAGVMVRGQWLPESELRAALEQLAAMYEHSSWQTTGYPEGGYEQLQADIERMLEQMAH
jgi:predicted amidohydrolase YtcJ